MATQPQTETLGLAEQIARIQKMQAEFSEILQDTTLAKPQMFFQGALAMAATIAAVAALAKLFF